MKDGVFTKIYDRLWLAVSLIAVVPVMAAALLTVAIGYPLHLMKRRIGR